LVLNVVKDTDLRVNQRFLKKLKYFLANNVFFAFFNVKCM
jgi:hypothetical protein